MSGKKANCRKNSIKQFYKPQNMQQQQKKSCE